MDWMDLQRNAYILSKPLPLDGMLSPPHHLNEDAIEIIKHVGSNTNTCTLLNAADFNELYTHDLGQLIFEYCENNDLSLEFGDWDENTINIDD
jgi:hypothetical protein